ncbi:MAG: hypothetical protein WDN30_08715 [Pararobbsia sp.]
MSSRIHRPPGVPPRTKRTPAVPSLTKRTPAALSRTNGALAVPTFADERDPGQAFADAPHPGHAVADAAYPGAPSRAEQRANRGWAGDAARPAAAPVSRPLDITVPLDRGWQLLGTPAGACATPHELPLIDGWIPAPVPGTVAQALRAAGRWDGDVPRAGDDLDGGDWWYVCRFAGAGLHMLRCDGLATLAEVWVDGVQRLSARNMFAMHEVELDLGDDPASDHTLHLVFRALDARPLRRQRWRQKLIAAPALRGLRSTALGRMPGWCAPVPAVGPWRGIALVDLEQQWITQVDVETRVADGAGIVSLRVEVRAARLARQACGGGRREDGSAVAMICGAHRNAMHRVDSNVFEGELRLPSVRLWWPHTHGEPALHDLSVEIAGTRFDLGRVGFRTIEADLGEDGAGFALVVNGVRVFCRGACWTAADLVALPATREAYEPWLHAARDAHMNMVRIAGVMTYEANPFFELCDELGILVWQDMMFANFDYPADDALFAADVDAEAEHLLLRTQANPSLAVVCGGSEVAQQAAMFGVEAREAMPAFFTERLPALVARYRPDLVYVPNSPSGGAQPFQPDTSIAHYYGVGAYLRGFDDVRRANVRFASECLALSNVPADETLAVLMPGIAPGTPALEDRRAARQRRRLGFRGRARPLSPDALRARCGRDPRGRSAPLPRRVARGQRGADHGSLQRMAPPRFVVRGWPGLAAPGPARRRGLGRDRRRRPAQGRLVCDEGGIPARAGADH